MHHVQVKCICHLNDTNNIVDRSDFLARALVEGDAVVGATVVGATVVDPPGAIVVGDCVMGIGVVGAVVVGVCVGGALTIIVATIFAPCIAQ